MMVGATPSSIIPRSACPLAVRRDSSANQPPAASKSACTESGRAVCRQVWYAASMTRPGSAVVTSTGQPMCSTTAAIRGMVSLSGPSLLRLRDASMLASRWTLRADTSVVGTFRHIPGLVLAGWKEQDGDLGVRVLGHGETDNSPVGVIDQVG